MENDIENIEEWQWGGFDVDGALITLTSYEKEKELEFWRSVSNNKPFHFYEPINEKNRLISALDGGYKCVIAACHNTVYFSSTYPINYCPTHMDITNGGYCKMYGCKNLQLKDKTVCTICII